MTADQFPTALRVLDFSMHALRDKFMLVHGLQSNEIVRAAMK